MTTPTMEMIAAQRRMGRRPHRSAIQAEMTAPRKQPACRVETMLALKLALASALMVSRPYFLVRSVSHLVVPAGNILLKRGHSQHSTNGTSIDTKDHSSEASGNGQGIDPPAVDFRRILLHCIVANDFSEKARHTGSCWRRRIGTKLLENERSRVGTTSI
jgi:hypothetical protein